MKTKNGISCPSCGRFVGAHDRCPYCGTGLKKRISLKSLRYTSLLVAIIGLVCLQLMAMNRETPAKKISDITPSMNFAYITIKGVASRPSKYYRDDDGKVSSCYIYLKDKTGSIRIVAYRQVAEKLFNKDVYILKGDEVEVSGKIKVVEGDKVSMMLEVPEHLKIKHKNYAKPEAAAENVSVKKLSDISINDMETDVTVEGRIAKFSKPREGSRAPYKIVIEQDGEKLPIVFWESVYNHISAPEKLVAGSKIRAKVSVAQYREKMQLKLRRSNDLTVLKTGSGNAGAATSTKKEISKIITADEAAEKTKGTKVKVRGKVVDVYVPDENSRAPNKIYLETSSGKIPIVFWSSRVQLEKTPTEGAVVEAKVTVGAYKDNKQLKLYRAEDLKIISEGKITGSSGKNDAFMPLDELWDAQVGSFVNVKGKTTKIFESKKETAPFKIVLADAESNTIYIVAWPDVWKSIPENNRPKVGDEISLKGKVKEYKQRKQIQLKRASDISVTRKN